MVRCFFLLTAALMGDPFLLLSLSYMVQYTGSIYTGFTRHVQFLNSETKIEKLIF